VDRGLFHIVDEFQLWLLLYLLLLLAVDILLINYHHHPYTPHARHQNKHLAHPPPTQHQMKLIRIQEHNNLMLNDLHRGVAPLDREISDMHLMMMDCWIDGMILSRKGVLDDRVSDYVEAVVHGRGVEGAIVEVDAVVELMVA
jgi:hypothetical protein